MTLQIAGGILLAVAVLVVTPFVVLALRDWRFWRCWARGHRWVRVEPFTHSTGMLSSTRSHRCARCGEVPGLLVKDLP